MSSDVKSSAATVRGAPLVPQLRFPEFQEAGAWKLKRLGRFLSESRLPGSKGDVARKITVRLWGGGVFAKNEAVQGSANTQYFERKAGQLIYSKLDFLNQAFGIIPDELDGYESTADLPCFDISSDLSPAFILEYVKRKGFYRRVGEAADGSRVAKRIHPEIFLASEVTLPPLLEQRKIADCLASADALIAGQGQKVEALRAYKKGLMQQLFPQEGETHPRLRFPEFEGTGEWKEVRLSTLGNLVSGLTYSPDDVQEEGLLVLRSSNIQGGKIDLKDCVYVDPNIMAANLSRPNDILVCVRNGSTALIGKTALIPDEMPLCTHGAFMTVFRSKAPKFAFQLFQTSRYQKQVAADLGATINSINGSQFLQYKFFVPKPPEQQRIADCLTSLDDLIAAETRKLDTLKTHKKGLTQQLFPEFGEG
ncbi:restriction endonuclease subunit S [Xanthobacter aminoxidans]|uniref:Restriction endonuclease subunit S n=1 Tax=Xanthobacter aminoxidans TaxID=186280 RepID=A0ABW6ZFP8_9HYPH